MFRDLPDTDVVVGQSLLVLVVCMAIGGVAVIADAYRRIPVARRHAFGIRRTLGAEALAAGTTMMFGVGWQKKHFALVAVADIVIRSPVRRRHLIRHPGSKGFRRLQRHASYCLGDIGYAVYDALGRVLRRQREVCLFFGN